MDWAANSDEVHAAAAQPAAEHRRGDARRRRDRQGPHRPHRAAISTWVDVVDDLVWLDGGKSFTWVSERDGWKHVYVVSRDGKSVRLVTKGTSTCSRSKGVDDKGGWLYYVASPDNPAQTYLFRTRLDGKGKPERLSPRNEPGTHSLRSRAQLQVRHRDLLQPREPAGHPAGPAARATRSSGRWWTTPGSRARVAGLAPGHRRMAVDPGRGRREDARACS